MSYNLQTVFTVRDNATAKIKQITKVIEQMNKALERAEKTSNRMINNLNQLSNGFNHSTTTIVRNTTVINNNSSTVNNNTNNLIRNTNVRNTMIGTIGRESSALKGLGSALAAVGGAYALASGGAKTFQATIGAAAKYEHSALALEGMIGDLKLTKEYLNLIENKAIKSPVLNSTDMLNNSKAFVGLSKNMSELEKMWDLVERVQAFSGVDTQQAAFSTKELFQGDYVSMMDAIGLDKRELQKITKMDGLGNKITALDKLLNKMGVTQEMTEKMGSSTLGQWSQLEEKAQSFFRKIGESGNLKIGKELTRLNKVFDALSTPQFIDKMDAMLGSVIEKAIDVGEFIWKWREPLAYAAGALAAVATAFVGVGIISALASPVALIAAGIAGTGVAMKALYDNSELFRGVIDGAIGRAKELWSVFKSDGLSGVISEIFPPNISETIQRVIASVGQLWGAFKTGGVGGVADMLFGEGTFEGITSKFNEIKTFILAKIAEMAPGFEKLKGIFSSVWGTISSIFSTVWNGVLKPGLANLWDALQILGNVAVVVFNNVIAPALQFAAALFSTLWSVAGPILSLLGAAVRVAFAVLKNVWDNILLPLVKFITGALKNAFEVFTDAVNIVGGAFDWVGGLIDKVVGKISDFADTIKNVKLPDWVTKGVNATVNFVGGAMDKFNAAVDGSHYHGLREVGKDGYRSILHRGEAVLPRQEAEFYRSIVSPGKSLAGVWESREPVDYNPPMTGVANISYEQASAGITNNNNTTNTYNTVTDKPKREQAPQTIAPTVTITGNQFTIREEADIDKIGRALVARLQMP